MNLTAIENQRNTVALEAFSFTTSLSELIGRTFPKLVSEFSDISSTVPANAEPLALTSEEKSFIKLLEKHKYVDIISLRAFVPSGLTASYLEYLNSFAALVQHVEEVSTRASQFSTYISGLLMNPDQVKDTHNLTTVYRAVEEKRAQLLKEVGQHFAQSSHNTETSYGKVVARNADWPMVFDLLEKQNTILNKIDRKALNKKSQEIATLLDKFIERYRKEGDLGGLSPEVVNNVADGAFQIAHEMELFAIAYYRLMAINMAVRDTMEAVKKSLAD